MDEGEVACPQCGHHQEQDTVYRANAGRDELLALGLSPTLVDFVFLEPKPKPFTSWCEPRENGWPSFLPPDVSAVYPLWSCNADLTVLWVRRGDREFVKLHHDDPTVDRLAKSEQGLLARLFVPLIEAQDWRRRADAERRLRQAADLVGFRYLDKLRELYDEHAAADDFNQRLDRLVAWLDRRA
jgi:hypothetical protein